MTPERKAELEVVVASMRAVSRVFYGGAVHVGHHAFIEFTGLINEYIDVCQNNLAAGVDFTETTVHGSGKGLKIEGFQRAYLAEKLSCIYGTSFPALMQGRADDKAERMAAKKRKESP